MFGKRRSESVLVGLHHLSLALFAWHADSDLDALGRLAVCQQFEAELLSILHRYQFDWHRFAHLGRLGKRVAEHNLREVGGTGGIGPLTLRHGRLGRPEYYRWRGGKFRFEEVAVAFLGGQFGLLTLGRTGGEGGLLAPAGGRLGVRGSAVAEHQSHLPLVLGRIHEHEVGVRDSGDGQGRQ